MDGHDPPRRLVQERAELDARGATRPEHRQEIARREARVDDVLDEHDVATGQVELHVEQDLDTTEGFLGVAVAADRHERDLEGQVDGAHQIREEHRAAFQHRDEHGLSPHIVPGDRAAELCHPAANVLAPVQDASDLRHRQEATSSTRENGQAATARTASATAPATASAVRTHQGPSAVGGGGTAGTISGTVPRTEEPAPKTSDATRSSRAGGYAARGSTTTCCERSSSRTGTSAVSSDAATTGTVPPRICTSPAGSPAWTSVSERHPS